MKKYFGFFIKGFAMGAANVVPGVSGGTIALITGIFERLVDAIKQFDLKAVKLFFSGKFKEFFEYTDFWFLVAVFGGSGVSIISLAKLLDFLFRAYEIYVWAFFFGLILASVFFVGRKISKWNISVIISFIIGSAFAYYISTINPATENREIWYLVLCGVAGIVSMILPGLSGSFVLILMGNYRLVMIDSINKWDFGVLIPVGLGMVVGIIAFSHLLSWIFKNYRNQTLSVLTGFIFGSLSILWPWKHKVFLVENGMEVLDKAGNPIILSYKPYFPDTLNNEVIIAFSMMLAGVVLIWAIEYFAAKSHSSE